jgi:23S rRNA (guanosine2251-2'-O)-methyltransferase
MHNIYGFHAVLARIKQSPSSVHQVWLNESRQDKRMQGIVDILQQHKIKYILTKVDELHKLVSKDASHQGVVAQVDEINLDTDLDSILDKLELTNKKAHILILDGITDPHNLGACLRVADAAGIHCIIAPKDNSASLSAVVSKVASGGAENIPYILVTNIARTIKHLQDRGVWVIGTSDKTESTIYDNSINLDIPIAWVMGAEGSGIRFNVQKQCDFLVSIPMHGSVSSLNISVATAICLYETLRRRSL